MIQVAWAAVALGFGTLGVLATALFRLGSRMDSGFDAMNARMDAMNARMDAGFAAMNARMDAMNARMDAVEAQLAEHIRRHAG